MAVRIRIARKGRTNHPFYRIGIYDSRTRRDGRCLENLGWYNPIDEKTGKQLSLNIAKTELWLSKGARPTPKAAALLKKAGVAIPQKKKAKKIKKETAKK